MSEPTSEQKTSADSPQNTSPFKDETAIISSFLKVHTAYDLLPDSGKVVVVDASLSLGAGFQALVENGISSAPVWDSKRVEYVALLTLADYVEVFADFYQYFTPEEFKECLEIVTIREWNKNRRLRPVIKEGSGLNGTPVEIEEKPALHARTPLIFIHPDASLLDSSKVLLTHHFHRGPVMDTETNTVLHILTHARLLRFIVVYANWTQDSRILEHTLEEVKIGNFGSLVTVRDSTPLHEVFSILNKSSVTAVPVLDANDTVIGLYSMSDVRFLPLDRIYDSMNMTVREALENRPNGLALHTCMITDKLKTIMATLARQSIHRVMVVDEDNHLKGILSINDLLRFFINTE
ncbi:putative 5'-AMP-activated protein kinase subunit gamma-1 [Blattamonas nauphoetae]|uniref:5'-AMP-activated protein kinase subunit gamma-1 n=1 Tax=Blattamonas nauphoetae TaxID=2049346 RepID=A0ABQ9Y438_9EUKA|nr:putative 5'-AMP-activated protein kinase subunit gamma-1 [Blattamonas nauphoetae]